MKTTTLRALSEWHRYAETLSDVKPVTFDIISDGELGADGFEITSDETTMFVKAQTARGLLYGAYAIIDTCRKAGDCFTIINTRETPDFEMRMLWSWGRLANTYRHSPFMALTSMLSYNAINDPENNTEVMRFVRHMASMRVNALVLTYELHTTELRSQDQHVYRPYYAQLRRFTEFLKEWGVDLYIYIGASSEKDFLSSVKDTDCPFDPVIRSYWDDVIKEFDEELPDLGGLLVAGNVRGAGGENIYQCQCEYCIGKSPTDRIFEQISHIACLLGKNNKQLVYTLTTDVPNLLYREVEIPLTLIDKLPENVTLSHKNQFQDFEELRYPDHPLTAWLPKREKLPVAVEYQLFPEMRGKGLILSNASDIWCREISYMHSIGSKCVIGVVETHPDDAHPSMAEWYVWGRLAWNSKQRASDLLADWTKINYPAGVDKVLPDLLLSSYMAASNIIYAGGVQCAAHGMLCPSPHFLKHAMNETWWGNEPAAFDVLGSVYEPFELYTKELQREIANNPRLFFLTNALKITPAVYDRVMKEKDAGISQYDALLALWRTVEPLFEPGDYRYRALADMLEKNTEDARRFRACISIFLRFHMRCLTERDILEARDKLTGPHAPCSISTCDASVADFLDRLRMMLLDIPFDAHFNNMLDLPQLTSPGWEEGAKNAVK